MTEEGNGFLPFNRKERGRRIGRRLRDEGIDRVMANAKEKWLADVRAVFDTLVESGQAFDADDLKAKARALGIDEPPHHPHAWGGLFGSAARVGRIAKVGMVQSATPTSHASVIGKWVKKQEQDHG